MCTPTGAELGRLDPEQLSQIRPDGEAKDTSALPTKEWQLHLALYRQRPDVAAVVHLHSRHAAAVSCRSDLDPDNTLPPLTSYYAMHIERLPLVPWHPPGDIGLAEATSVAAKVSRSLLLANHGPVVGAATLSAGARAAEEIEETSAIWLTLAGQPYRALSQEQLERLRRTRKEHS